MTVSRLAVLISGVAALGFLVAADGQAGPCDPPMSDVSIVPAAIPISPNGALAYTVQVIDCHGPINGSRVNVLFNTVGDSLVCWCNTSPYVPGTPHSFFQTTNGSGVAVFHIAGGGCIERGLAAIPGDLNFAAEVFADLVKLQECGVVSPDGVDSAGRLSTSTPTWNPAGVCATGLSDAVLHTGPLATATYRWCSDLNGDHAVSISDAVILTPFLATGTSCPGNAGN